MMARTADRGALIGTPCLSALRAWTHPGQLPRMDVDSSRTTLSLHRGHIPDSREPDTRDTFRTRRDTLGIRRSRA